MFTAFKRLLSSSMAESLSIEPSPLTQEPDKKEEKDKKEKKQSILNEPISALTRYGTILKFHEQNIAILDAQLKEFTPQQTELANLSSLPPDPKVLAKQAMREKSIYNRINQLNQNMEKLRIWRESNPKHPALSEANSTYQEAKKIIDQYEASMIRSTVIPKKEEEKARKDSSGSEDSIGEEPTLPLPIQPILALHNLFAKSISNLLYKFKMTIKRISTEAKSLELKIDEYKKSGSLPGESKKAEMIAAKEKIESLIKRQEQETESIASGIKQLQNNLKTTEPWLKKNKSNPSFSVVDDFYNEALQDISEGVEEYKKHRGNFVLLKQNHQRILIQFNALLSSPPETINLPRIPENTTLPEADSGQNQRRLT